MKKEYLLFIIFPLSQLLMIVGDYMAVGGSETLSSLGVVSSIIADIVLLVVLIHGAKKDKVERELENIKYLKELETTRNEMMEKSQKELYAMKKDFEQRMEEINNHLQAGNIKEKDRQLEAFQEVLENTRPNVYCNHVIANAILNEKNKECEKLGFSIDMDLLIPRKVSIEPLHMCSIFSNLLDNAIEAVSKLKEQERKIKLAAEVKGNYLMIKVENTSTKEHATQKKRKDRGYGTLILNDISKKYDGQYTCTFEKGVFTAVMAVKVA